MMIIMIIVVVFIHSINEQIKCYKYKKNTKKKKRVIRFNLRNWVLYKVKSHQFILSERIPLNVSTARVT